MHFVELLERRYGAIENNKGLPSFSTFPQNLRILNITRLSLLKLLSAQSGNLQQLHSLRTNYPTVESGIGNLLD